MRFYANENCDGNFIISIDEIPFSESAAEHMSGSYNVLAARLLGFTYPDYLRYVRQNCGAELRGRAGYSYCVFKNKADAIKLVMKLNAEWNKVENALKKESK